MDDLSVKKSALIDPTGAAAGKRTEPHGLAGLANTFRDLVKGASVNVDSGLNAISDKAGISAAGEAPKRADLDDVYDDAPKGQDQDRSVERGYGDGRGRDDREVSRAERPDIQDSDPRANHRDDGRDARADNSGDHRDDSRSDEPAHADKPANDDHRDGSENSASDEGQGERESAADGENNGENAGENGNAANQDGQSAGNSAENAAAQAATPTQALAAVAALKTIGGPAHTEAGAASDTGKENAAAGLAQAAGATGKNAGGQAGTAHQGQAGNQAAQAQAAAAQQAETKTEGEVKTGATVRDQAQQLAKALGNDVKVQVNVGVTQEAESVTSKPLSSLTSATTLAGDGKSSNQSGQQSNNNANPGNANAIVAAATQQTQNTQAQAQAQQANTQGNQAQAATQLGGEAKLALASAGSAHAGGATAATGDSSAANATTNAAQQPQNAEKSAAAQTTNLNRPANISQNVAEQVSVKITKALQAGNDRISIKLNPAELGRVEVKMELGHDGRVMAVVTAEKQDTLDLLRRDASDLQKALQEGGMDLNSGDMTFNLKGEEGELAENNGSGNGGDGDGELADDGLDVPAEILTAQDGGVLANGRIDVRA